MEPTRATGKITARVPWASWLARQPTCQSRLASHQRHSGQTFQLQLQAWWAAGIFPAFSTGGTVACNALGSPGDNPEAFGTAAHNSTGYNLYAGGPSCDPGAHEVNPHVNSPTFGRTANSSGGYENLGGSSGSIPHVAGTVALVWSANPSYIGQIWDTFTVLEQSANKNVPAGNCGEPACAVNHVPNFEYGWGYLDAYAAVTAVGVAGLLHGTVADARSGALLPGVNVSAALAGGGEWFAVTDPTGYYSMALDADTYTVTAHADGFLDDAALVIITGNMTTTQDLALEPNAPWIDFAPRSFARTLEPGKTATDTFAIHNLGPVSCTWNISEYPVKTGAGDIAWLAADPISGTVAAYSSFTGGEIYYDAGAVAGPGDYVADLYVRSDDPIEPELAVPVTLTVLVTGLEGNVVGTGYCNTESEPLDAQLVVAASDGTTYIAATDPTTGYYSLWLNPGTYTVTATAADHLPATQVVQLQAGMTTPLDLALRLVESCMNVTPTSFSLTLPMDSVYTGTLSILNGGAGDLMWESHETPAQPWVRQVPTSGLALPDTVSAVAVAFDTHGLARDECYTTSLEIVHDDPGMPNPYEVPIELCTTPVVPTFSLSKAATPDLLSPGGMVTFTLSFGNDGDAVYGVTVRDVLPAGVALVSASDSGDYDPAAHDVTWACDLSTGEQMTFTTTALVRVEIDSDTWLTNVAYLNWNGIHTTATAAIQVQRDTFYLYLPLVYKQ